MTHFAPGLEPVVCGVHALNGVAFNAHQAWALRRADVRAIAESPFRLPTGARASMAHIRALPENEYGAPRLLLILEQVLGTWPAWLAQYGGRGRIAVALALPERHAEGGSLERFAKERTQLREALGAVFSRAGSAPEIAIHAFGHAAAAYSLEWAGQLVASNAADIALVAGIDSYYDPDVFDSLVERARIYDGSRLDGFVPGEGGALAAISSARFARDHGLSILARVECASVAVEPSHSFEGMSSGRGLTSAVRAATERIAREGRSVDWWLGDVSTESYRVRELELALPRFTARVSNASSRLEQLPEHFGDLGAATLPTAIAIAAESFVRGDPRAQNCLLFASSDGPTRGAVLLRNGFMEGEP
jgi:3-oxoacyl-[acyl-carrier-protein] synthase I